MTHEHNWIDISVVNEACERQKCIECGMERRREFMTEEWTVTRTTLKDGTVIWIEEHSAGKP